MLKARKQTAGRLNVRLTELADVFNSVVADDLAPLAPLAEKTYAPAFLADSVALEAEYGRRVGLHLRRDFFLRLRIVSALTAAAPLQRHLRRRLQRQYEIPGSMRRWFLDRNLEDAVMMDTMREGLEHLLRTTIQHGENAGLRESMRLSRAFHHAVVAARANTRARGLHRQTLLERATRLHDRLAACWLGHASNNADAATDHLGYLGARMRLEKLDAADLEARYKPAIMAARNAIESGKAALLHGIQHADRLQSLAQQPPFRQHIH